jgi:hypothetical protein
MKALWTGVLALAMLWPSRTLSWFGGMPLDGRVEALLVGLIGPALWWVHGRFLERRAVRAAILAVLVLKVAGSMLLTQQGLCARFSTPSTSSTSSMPGPYHTEVLTIPIDEPNGVLRSWDVRAGWRAASPSCTAVIDRPYTVASAFPAWFVNITDFASSGHRDLAMDVSGYARVDRPGRLSIDLDRDMTMTGTIGSERVSSRDGSTVAAELDAGVHRLDLHARLTGDRWRLVPKWNDRDAFGAALLTVAEPRALDGAAARVLNLIAASLAAALLAAWVLAVVVEYIGSPGLLAWCVMAACVLAACGATGRFERLSALILLVAVFVPVAEPHRNLRGAFLLVGVPWLALFAARTLPQVGHFSAYSNDDWLAYQVAGYRIFMHGFWLEGGSKVFDYQPLYRWMSGLLHLIFGDSSVGEAYWDAGCLLLGALVAFALVKPAAGFRWATAAAAATLATFSLGTIWYFVGRGLSEVAAAGWAFLAAIALLRAQNARAAVAVAAGALAVLMFYTRLNHLLFAVSLLALLVPADVPARWRDVFDTLPRINLRAAVFYAATFAAGVVLFATRTWWYTGVFSVLYGTSLKNNDTGLRLGTIASQAVRARIGHSLRALVWMNEPPAAELRALIVAAGVVLSILALLQVPRLSRLPFAIAVVTLGACASSLFAHTHNYPGRMSIHLAPFAIAMTANAGARLFGR